MIDIEEAKKLAESELERMEKEKKQLINKVASQLEAEANVKKLFQLGKDSLLTNFSKFVIEHYSDFEEAMLLLKEEKPTLFVKYFLELQKNAFPLKKEEGANIKNLNLIASLSDEQLRRIAKGESLDVIDVQNE